MKNRVETRGRLPSDSVERTKTAMYRDMARLGIYVRGVQGRFHRDEVVGVMARSDSRTQKRMLQLLCQQAYGGFVAYPEASEIMLKRVHFFFTSGGLPRKVSNVPQELIP